MKNILLFILVFVQANFGLCQKIDRYKLVSRHNIILNNYDYRNALQVGNGQIAFSLDITGLQSFDSKLAILSEWGWHCFPKPDDVQYEHTLSDMEFFGHKASYADPGIIKRPNPLIEDGRKSYYSYKSFDDFPSKTAKKKENAFWWYRFNPHRLFLGQIGMEIILKDGRKAELNNIENAVQKLDLWSGTIYSNFEVEGESVEVVTCCHPNKDILAVNINSTLVEKGRLKLFWHFPYMKPNPNDGPDYNNLTAHLSIIKQEPNIKQIQIKRVLDSTYYFTTIKWTGKSAKFDQVSKHKFILSPAEGNSISFVTCFTPDLYNHELPNFKKIFKRNSVWWQTFWENGGAIDLSGSKDTRWKELERRIVLSQYLTAIQCSGESPPQETGLFTNSWYGKFHLEMTAWHGVHFALWNREKMLENWMNWLAKTGIKGAKERASRQGYNGVRWNKMIDKYASWESPSGTGPYRITQQGHIIYLAELLYNIKQNNDVLDKYSEMVFSTADFMADFLNWDSTTKRYVIGPPVKSGAETVFAPDAQNPTVGLSYWAYGLKTAQKWKERLNLPKNKNWDQILNKLSFPPVKDSVYINMVSHSNDWKGRPAWLEAYGCMPGVRIDPDIMLNTYNKIASNYDYWEKWIWGCDFPMLAMTAARLGKPQEAIDWLLFKTQRNIYLKNGTNIGGPHPYYPANGGLLWAIAMMCAGWDGAPDTYAPGFPDNGMWNVKFENLRKVE